MKKLKDLIYDYNDIFVTLLIVIIAAAIIFWRVDGIMGYSDYLASKSTEQEIDIDFTDVDLDPIKEDDPVIDPSGEDDVIDNPPSESVIVNPVPDKSFVSNKDIEFTIPKGAGPGKIGRVVATAYGYENDDCKNFIQAFEDVSKDLGLETKMHYGDYSIKSGTSIQDIIRILAHQL